MASEYKLDTLVLSRDLEAETAIAESNCRRSYPRMVLVLKTQSPFLGLRELPLFRLAKGKIIHLRTGLGKWCDIRDRTLESGGPAS